MISSCRREGASEGAEISNRRESIAPVADVELETSTAWCLTLTNGLILILVRDIAVGHVTITGDRGHHLHAGDWVRVGEEARTPTTKHTSVTRA
jgi:hypothetical protein